MTASRTAPSPSRAAPEKPSAGRFSVIALAPTFEVMTTMVLRKSARRPSESVRRPSSIICNSRLYTSSCAFSISSKSTTDQGLRRTRSVSWPPSP